MGLLDNAKNRLSNTLNKANDEEEVLEEDNVVYHPTKPEKPNKPGKGKPEKPMKPSSINFDDEDEPLDEVKQSRKESVFEFDPEEEDYFDRQQKAYDETMKRYENVPELSVDEKRITNVLDVLNIPETFALESDIFIPEDLEDIYFSQQAPVGYEMGEVDYFVHRAQSSIKRYYNIAKLRNDHIAKLATMIDKLQVDNSNLKLQQELNAGISVMTSSSSDDLENQLMEATLTIRRLEDEVARFNGKDELNQRQKDKYKTHISELKDQLSIVERENEALKEENYGLKNQVALHEEDYPEEKQARTAPVVATAPTAMPPVEASEEVVLPEVEVPTLSSGTPSGASQSVFLVDDEDDFAGFEGPEFEDNSSYGESTVEVVGGPTPAPFTYSEDEEDDLDKMMKEWNA